MDAKDDMVGTSKTAIQIRVGGYGPADSVHSLAVAHFADRMHARVGDAVDIQIINNIMDLGRPASDLLDMVEGGELTWCYFSTSYLGTRVPELQVLERPYVFADLDAAHTAVDGALGDALSQATHAQTGLRVLGYWDNGFRHFTNHVRAVHLPEDLAGMRVRLQPNPIHAEMVATWGGVPVPAELSAGIEMITSLQVEAQENPLANSVAYGVDQVHNHVTMTGHLYGARGIYANPAQLDTLPRDVLEALQDSVADAIAFQRTTAARYEVQLRERLERGGLRFVDLTPKERAAFSSTVEHLTNPPDV